MLLYTILTPLIIILTGLTICELKTGIIPNEVTLPLAIYLLVITPFDGHLSMANHWFALVTAILLLALVNRILNKLYSRDQSLGGGFMKLFAALSIAMGIQETVISLALFCILGTVFGFILRNRIAYLPSTPILLAALAGTYLWYFYGSSYLIM